MAGGFPLRVNGLRIFTSEALYQACRFPHRPEVQRLIIGQTSPMTAKMKSKPYRHDSRPDWDQVRVKIMRWCLRVKLAQNWKTFSELLLKTDDRPIVEESRKDGFWGARSVDERTFVGMNVLGRLLMELREAVKTSHKEMLLQVEPLAIPDFLLDGHPIQVVSAPDHKEPDSIYELTEREKRSAPATRGSSQASLFEQPAVKETSAAYLAVDRARVATFAHLKPYPTMKDSCVPWLGEIPKHWDINQGFSSFKEKQEKNTGMIETKVLSLSYGKVVVKPPEKLHGLVPASFETYQIVDPGEIIIRPTDLQNDKTSLRVGMARDRGIITSAYLCLRTMGPLIPEYGYLLLHAYDVKKIFYGMGSGLRQNLGFKDLKRMPVLSPPREEQSAITTFLAQFDRRITRLIRAKRRLIELLNEQKQAIIHRAVTRGLDPNAPLKPSGMKCLEEIPAHWKMLPLKRWVSAKITDGPHETPPLIDEGVDFVSAESMGDGYFDFERRRGFISQELHERYCQKCRPQRGDIFMCKSGATTGKVALVETDREFSVWSPLALIRADKRRVLPRLLFFVLQARYVQRQVQDTWSYGTQQNLSMGAMERLLILLPPLTEQHELLTVLKAELDTIESVTGIANRQIELLHEYRTRLIADVVTGQLDVRGVELPKLDETEMVEDREIGEEAEVDETGDSEEVADGDEQ